MRLLPRHTDRVATCWSWITAVAILCHIRICIAGNLLIEAYSPVAAPVELVGSKEKMAVDLIVVWGPGGVSKVRGGQHTLVERLGYKVQGNASRLGTWTDADKAELLALVAELQPCGAADWEVIADKLGRWSKVPAPPRPCPRQ